MRSGHRTEVIPDSDNLNAQKQEIGSVRQSYVEKRKEHASLETSRVATKSKSIAECTTMSRDLYVPLEKHSRSTRRSIR